jgi:hypothetical protein
MFVINKKLPEKQENNSSSVKKTNWFSFGNKAMDKNECQIQEERSDKVINELVEKKQKLEKENEQLKKQIQVLNSPNLTGTVVDNQEDNRNLKQINENDIDTNRGGGKKQKNKTKKQIKQKNKKTKTQRRTKSKSRK